MDGGFCGTIETLAAMKFTTSWDDGHVLDLRVAELLAKYQLQGTFYIAQDYAEKRLTDEQIQDLSQGFEIGAHTLTHPDLTIVDLDKAREEIAGSRRWLQDLTGQPINAFCYPRGRFTPQVRQIVIDAGFTVARTVEAYQLSCGDDPFAMPTTLHVYPFSLASHVRLAGVDGRGSNPFGNSFRTGSA